MMTLSANDVMWCGVCAGSDSVREFGGEDPNEEPWELPAMNDFVNEFFLKLHCSQVRCTFNQEKIPHLHT